MDDGTDLAIERVELRLQQKIDAWRERALKAEAELARIGRVWDCEECGGYTVHPTNQ